ncbi:MAG TPA: glycosyl hydrolase 53 family protein [Chloroflexota bacterium]|nr:glycosyl hydrolase 53 family protein [Chloroflexota bacterium]
MYGLGSYIVQRYRGLAKRSIYRAWLTGADWLREEFTADKLHRYTNGRYHWWAYDRVVARERAAGFHILGLIDYNNTWDGHDHAYMPHYMIRKLSHDFAKYAYAIARHYRGIINYWQVWNEPDLHLFWHPYPNPTDYARLLRRAYRAIKRANPQATVVLGGPSGADPHPLAFIHRVVAAGGRFDVLSVQPYEDVPDLSLLSEVRALRWYGKPIWFTEMGWAGETNCASVCGTEQSQAVRLARLYLVAAYAGVQRVFWYDLRDDGTGAIFEDHFGLLEHDLAAKPAFVAYEVSRYFLNRATLTGVDTLGPQVFAFRFRNHGAQFVVVWNNELGSYGLRIPWSWGPARVLNWSGRAVASTGDGVVTMTAYPRSILYIVPDRLEPRRSMPGPA